MSEAISTPTAPAAEVPVTPSPTPPGGSPPAEASFLGDGGSFNWDQAANYLPPEMHGSIDGLQARFGEGKTVADVIGSFTELEAEYTQTRQKMAVPDDATLTAYGIEKPPEMSDADWATDSAKLEPFLAAAHEGGVGKEGFAKLHEAFVAHEQKRSEASEVAGRENRQAAAQVLNQKWGADAQAKGETALNHAKAEIDALDLQPEQTAQAQELLDNPVFVELMHRGALSSQEGGVTLPPGAVGNPMSAAEKGHDIMNNPQNALYEKFREETASGGGPTVDYVMSLRSKVQRPKDF